MRYNLGRFRYDNGAIYVIVWRFIPIKLFDYPGSYRRAVEMVNFLAGLE